MGLGWKHDVVSHAGAAQLRENGKFWLLGGGRQTAPIQVAVIRASDRAVGQNGVLARIHAVAPFGDVFAI